QMLALYRAGRQAEALAAYQEVRRMLGDELGLEPSPALRDLQRRILEQDRDLGPALAAAPPPAARPPPSPDGTTCVRCGSELPPAARFCPCCGAAADAPATEMRKLATMLFADVVDSTARGAALDPEDARALMSDFFEAMAVEIRAEGGTIEK